MAENKTCSVAGCENEVVKTLSKEKVEKIFSLKVETRRVHLCKEHYKEYKKKTKKDREVERAGWIK